MTFDVFFRHAVMPLIGLGAFAALIWNTKQLFKETFSEGDECQRVQRPA